MLLLTGMGLAICGVMAYQEGVKAKYEDGKSDEEVAAETYLYEQVALYRSLLR